MQRTARRRVWRALAWILLTLALATAMANAPEQPYPWLADAEFEPVVPQASTNDDAAWTEILHVMDEYTATLDAGDLSAWLALWESDGIQMPPGTPMRTGVDAIREGMRPLFMQFDDEIRINVLEVTRMGDWAYARGTYFLTSTPKHVEGGEAPVAATVDGKFLTVLHHHSDGSWKIYRDIFNTNDTPR